jgi:hypothetical protein
MSSPIGPATHLPGTDATALRILARSLVRELSKRGYSSHHIIALVNELIDLVCESMRSNRDRR